MEKDKERVRGGEKKEGRGRDGWDASMAKKGIDASVCACSYTSMNHIFGTVIECTDFHLEFTE